MMPSPPLLTRTPAPLRCRSFSDSPDATSRYYYCFMMLTRFIAAMPPVHRAFAIFAEVASFMPFRDLTIFAIAAFF